MSGSAANAMTCSALRTIVVVTIVFGLTTGCAPRNPNRRPTQDPAVTAAEIAQYPHEPIERVLQRKVSGVIVTRTPDGTIALQLRGNTSFVGSDAPLYVIDDVAVEPGPGGELTGINPYDIATIRVLKGADAGIYGIRGMNGVIVVNLKKPAARP